MRQYRKIASNTEQQLLKELNELKEEKLKSISSDKPEPEPKFIDIMIEKPAKVIKETPDYANIPEGVIGSLIDQGQSAIKEQRQVKRKEKIKKHLRSHKINRI